MKRNLFFYLTLIVVLLGCNNQPESDSSTKSKEQIALEKDSLKGVIVPKEKPDEVQTLEPEAVNENIDSRRAGKHPITLQWISWDKPGEVIIKPLDQEWYSISGSQINNGTDILRIEGKIRRLSKKELEFEGTITTKVSSNYGGELCVKSGKQKFYAKDNRQYFRLQNMINCEGGMLVDYIDIYKGTSSL